MFQPVMARSASQPLVGIEELPCRTPDEFAAADAVQRADDPLGIERVPDFLGVKDVRGLGVHQAQFRHTLGEARVGCFVLAHGVVGAARVDGVQQRHRPFGLGHVRGEFASFGGYHQVLPDAQGFRSALRTFAQHFARSLPALRWLSPSGRGLRRCQSAVRCRRYLPA